MHAEPMFREMRFEPSGSGSSNVKRKTGRQTRETNYPFKAGRVLKRENLEMVRVRRANEMLAEFEATDVRRENGAGAMETLEPFASRICNDNVNPIPSDTHLSKVNDCGKVNFIHRKLSEAPQDQGRRLIKEPDDRPLFFLFFVLPLLVIVAVVIWALM